MANLDRPMGLIPVKKLDGSKIPTMRFKINTAAANMGVGDPVSKDAAGGVERATASDGPIIVGVIEQLQDSNGNPIGGPNSSVSTKYLALGESGYAVVSLALPDAVFRIQSSGSTVEADIWNHADMVITGVNTTTARSQTELDQTTQQAAALRELQIVGKVDEPGNDWGTNVDLLVTFSESTWDGAGTVTGT